MSPNQFTFKLTVPRDPQVAAIITELATHAVTYGEIDAAVGAEFVTRVGAAAARALASTMPDSLHVVVSNDATALTVALDADLVSITHAA